MGANSGIAWTHHTFNPWWGCTKVSPGCKNCYAEKFATVRRKLPIWGADAPRKIASEAMWRQPLLWNRRAAEKGVRERVFCASMADVFEDYQGPDWSEVLDARTRLWDLIEATPSLDWLLLTKRPDNAAEMLMAKWGWHLWPEDAESEVVERGNMQMIKIPQPVMSGLSLPPNLWFGITVEDQEQAEKRLLHLRAIPAVVKFVSYEPALEYVDFGKWLRSSLRTAVSNDDYASLSLSSVLVPDTFIDWLIVGGESSTGARPFNPAWANQVVEQCKAAQTPVFVKQFGSNPTLRSGSGWGPVTAPKGDDMSEWPAQLRVREVPGNA